MRKIFEQDGGEADGGGLRTDQRERDGHDLSGRLEEIVDPGELLQGGFVRGGVDDQLDGDLCILIADRLLRLDRRALDLHLVDGGGAFDLQLFDQSGERNAPEPDQLILLIYHSLPSPETVISISGALLVSSSSSSSSALSFWMSSMSFRLMASTSFSMIS